MEHTTDEKKRTELVNSGTLSDFQSALLNTEVLPLQSELLNVANENNPPPLHLANETNNDSDSDSNVATDPPKKFLAKSLAESLFNGLLQKLRHPGIPRQRGFIHLNKLDGYGATLATKRFPKDRSWQIRPLRGLVRSTRKLTQQTIQEACEKERQRRLRIYHQNGIPRYRAFIDFLDEFRELVRDAERRDQIESAKKDIHTESNWATVMEEIRHKGMLSSIHHQIEVQREDTIRDISSVLSGQKNHKESAAMAAVNDVKKVVHDDLKAAVKKMMETAKSEGDNLTAYYTDLKDQMVRALHHKAHAVQSMQQMIMEVRIRWEQNQELRNDPIRQKAIERRTELHVELQSVYRHAMKEAATRSNHIINKQAGLKGAVLEDVLDTYWKEKTFADFTKAKQDHIREEALNGHIRDPISERTAHLWNDVQDEINTVERN